MNGYRKSGTYTMKYYSAIKKKEGNNAICIYIGGHRDYHIKSNRERQISFIWNLKKWYKIVFTKERLTDIKKQLMVTSRGKREEG